MGIFSLARCKKGPYTAKLKEDEYGPGGILCCRGDFFFETRRAHMMAIILTRLELIGPPPPHWDLFLYPRYLIGVPESMCSNPDIDVAPESTFRY